MDQIISNIKKDVNDSIKLFLDKRKFIKHDPTSLSYLRRDLNNIIAIKYIWSAENNLYGLSLISDLLLCFTQLMLKNDRTFYLYARSSIENFYKSSLLLREEKGYFSAKEEFTDLVSHQKNFNYIEQRKNLMSLYRKFSNKIHFNPAISDQSLDVYISEAVSKDAFSEKEKIQSAIMDLTSLVNDYMYFYWNFPSFEPLENGFYKHKIEKKYFENSFLE